jgi:hypothetical protein
LAASFLDQGNRVAVLLWTKATALPCLALFIYSYQNQASRRRGRLAPHFKNHHIHLPSHTENSLTFFLYAAGHGYICCGNFPIGIPVHFLRNRV